MGDPNQSMKSFQCSRVTCSLRVMANHRNRKAESFEFTSFGVSLRMQQDLQKTTLAVACTCPYQDVPSACVSHKALCCRSPGAKRTNPMPFTWSELTSACRGIAAYQAVPFQTHVCLHRLNRLLSSGNKLMLQFEWLKSFKSVPQPDQPHQPLWNDLRAEPKC